MGRVIRPALYTLVTLPQSNATLLRAFCKDMYVSTITITTITCHPFGQS